MPHTHTCTHVTSLNALGHVWVMLSRPQRHGSQRGWPRIIHAYPLQIGAEGISSPLARPATPK